MLPQESNQLATPVESSDPAHDSLDPLPSPANTVCVSEEVVCTICNTIYCTVCQGHQNSSGHTYYIYFCSVLYKYCIYTVYTVHTYFHSKSNAIIFLIVQVIGTYIGANVVNTVGIVLPLYY